MKVTEGVNNLVRTAEENKEDVGILRVAKAIISSTGREQDQIKIRRVDKLIENKRIMVKSKIGERLKEQTKMNIVEIGRTEQEKTDKMMDKLESTKIC